MNLLAYLITLLATGLIRRSRGGGLTEPGTPRKPTRPG
jgi:hypothetical protein